MRILPTLLSRNRISSLALLRWQPLASPSTRGGSQFHLSSSVCIDHTFCLSVHSRWFAILCMDQTCVHALGPLIVRLSQRTAPSSPRHRRRRGAPLLGASSCAALPAVLPRRLRVGVVVTGSWSCRCCWKFPVVLSEARRQQPPRWSTSGRCLPRRGRARGAPARPCELVVPDCAHQASDDSHLLHRRCSIAS